MTSFHQHKHVGISRAILAKKPCVLVLFPPEADGASLLTQLRRIGCSGEICWPHPPFIDARIDLIFLYISPEVEPMDYGWLQENGPPIISVVNFENPTMIDEALRIGVMAILMAPIKASGLLSTIITTLHQHAKNRHNSDRFSQLEKKVISLKLLEEAKRILIEKQKIFENEAYELLRSQAMAQRIPIEDIAREIIQSERIMSKIISGGPKNTI
ncbi:MAG: ANTAR domain-containing protein [Sulfuriferula multivorans]|uniref:ANTAR domain-containing protein n=1 Tax=Sulfuriferula multivorans TaxID=1559896 RepID=A0A7C9TA93_9PROT|nr:ANTAR domain-containing protein [Sulfuriferula multivorans]